MKSKIIYTCIFGDYDTLHHPAVVTNDWQYICYTDQDLTSDIWEIRKVHLLPEGPRRTARWHKIMFHKHMCEPISGCIYVDGSFLINCDLNEWWDQHFQSPMTCIRHPIRNCVYEEAKAVVRNNRGGIENIEQQIEYYRNAITVPSCNGLIQSGILMREFHPDTIALCEKWWEHLQLYSARDQLAFAAASYELPIHHTMKWDYRTGKEFVFKGHRKR